MFAHYMQIILALKMAMFKGRYAGALENETLTLDKKWDGMEWIVPKKWNSSYILPVAKPKCIRN